MSTAATPLTPVDVAIRDLTHPGTFTPTQLFNTVWSAWYFGAFQFNRSPWVEHGYTAALRDLHLVESTPPTGAWLIELLNVSSEPGALGWHEDRSIQSTAHSRRGVKLHAGSEVPAAVIGVDTSREDGVSPTEVLCHELAEMLVDPWVMTDDQLRKYLNPVAKEWYIAEVGDPCQGRGYDVRAPEGRASIAVPEAIVCDFAYPSWWGQAQTRRFTSAAEEFGLSPRLEPFQLAPGGYMSVSPEANPTEWTQVYGSDRPKAEANAHAYERRGEVG